MGYSKNAIMAKCRALYGKSLKPEDYEAMLNCKQISDIVSYLKSETHYAQSFEKATQNMDTPQIEELLRLHTLKTLERVSRYEFSSGAKFYESLLMKNDVQQILRFLHFLIIDKPEGYLKVLPPFFNEYSEIDLYSLAKSQNFGEMLDSLKGTAFKKALTPFLSTYKDPRSYLQMELALDEKLWEKEKIIVENYKGKSKQSISKVLAYQNDMENLIRIYRLKKIGGEVSDSIKRYLNLTFTNFSQKEIDLLISADTASDMLSLATGTYYKNYFTKFNFNSLEDFTQKILFDKFSKEIRYSTEPITVMISYFALSKNEVQNVIHIVEGIRYGMSPEAIKSVLIY